MTVRPVYLGHFTSYTNVLRVRPECGSFGSCICFLQGIIFIWTCYQPPTCPYLTMVPILTLVINIRPGCILVAQNTKHTAFRQEGNNHIGEVIDNIMRNKYITHLFLTYQLCQTTPSGTNWK